MQTSLHQNAKDLSTKYKKIEFQLIDVLQKIDQQKIFYHYNCSSLFQYCMIELGLSESTSYNLIRISRKSNLVPELKEQVKSGQITSSKAARICSVLKPLDPKHNEAWFNKAKTLSSRDLEKAILIERPKEYSLKEKKKILSPINTSLIIKLEKVEMQKIDRAKTLLEKKKRRTLSYTETLLDLTDFYLKKNDPLKQESKNRPYQLKKQRQKLPKQIEIKLHKKQDSKCSRCQSQSFLEIHHKVPLSRGGANELTNLDLLCSPCHRRHHYLLSKSD